MEGVRKQVTPDALNRACVLTGTGTGPFVDFGMRPPTDSAGRWLVSRRAVVAMAKALDLPSGRDVETLEREFADMTRQRDALVNERDGLLRVVASLRRVLGLEGVPTESEMDEAEAVVAEYLLVGATPEPAGEGSENDG